MASFDDHRPFTDRHDAGVELAFRLGRFKGHEDVVVLALPRGGVPVASEVARAPDRFAAVGQWCRDFSQTSDEEVHELLRDAVSAAPGTR